MKSHVIGFSVVLLWLLISSSSQEVVIRNSCLTTTDTKVPLTNLLSYTVQNKPLFPVDALRFRTVKGKTICSDPSSPWAKNAKKYLDSKNKPYKTVPKKLIVPASVHLTATVIPRNASTTNETQTSTQTFR